LRFGEPTEMLYIYYVMRLRVKPLKAEIMNNVNIKLSELEVSNRTLGVMRRLNIDTLDEVNALYNKIERGK